MKLLVGLGNPGPQYFYNRHNAGFLTIDAIAESLKTPPFKSKYHALFTEGALKGQRILLLKPQTYMNLSGKSVSEVACFYKIPIEDIYVFHDELDVKLGKVKVKCGGGAGGHNGLKSLDALVGNGYHRVRIGIGHPGHKDLVSAYVLSNFTPTEQEIIQNVIDKIADCLPDLLWGSQAQFLATITPFLNK